jgi:Tfp pilus assembly protein PilW
MKLPLNHPRVRQAGFTLVEIYVVSMLLAFLVIAIVATQIFAARVYTLAATKLTSTASGREVMNTLRDQIKQARDLRVGFYTPTNNAWLPIGDGTNMTGNALIIAPTNLNTMNSGTIYFMNPLASNLCSVAMVNGAVQPSTLVSNIVVYITNYYVFTAEDFSTNILTTYVNDRVIRIIFQFAEWEYPLAGIGNGAMYDYYQLQTRATMRLIDY